MDKLDCFFRPRSVAVIGASRNPKKIGHVILRNFLEGTFHGRVYPINPKTDRLFGLPCYPSVLRVPGRIELAVISVPAPLVPKVLDECGRKGIPAVIIISGGFGEIGNTELEHDCLRIIKKHKMRAIGPNCVSGDTPILVKNSGHLKYFEIGDLAERLIEENMEEALNITDTITVPVKRNIELPSWDGNGIVYRKISKVMKRNSQRGLLRFKIMGGKDIICSPDHPFMIRKVDKIIKVPSSEVKIGDEALLINDFNQKYDYIEELNLVKEFMKKTTNEERKNIFVRYKGKNYSLEGFVSKGYEEKSASIKILGSRIKLPTKLRVTEDLCKVLGFFIADGNYKQDFLSIGYVKGVEEEQTLRNHINNIFIGSSLRNGSVCKEIKFGRKIGQLLFKKVFGIKQGAINKNIPDFIFSTKPGMIIHFLSGLLSGDGTISKHITGSSGTIHLSSISKNLIKQTQYLFNIIGVGPFYIVKEKRSNAVIKGVRCNARDLYFLRSDSKQTISKLYEMGFRFIIPRKNRILDSIIETKLIKKIGKKERGGLCSRKIVGIDIVNGPQDVYDFEVEGTHNFFANGILTSNCVGVVDPYTGVDTFFLPRYKLERPEKGSVAFISQSGALGSVVLDWMAMKGYKISKFISYGNALDVDEADLTEYLANDPSTNVICCYFEGLKQGRKFYETLRKVSGRKPVIIIKGGRTKEGTRAVSSHTGSLAGSREVHSAAFRQAGGIEAGTLEELFDFARVLATQPTPKNTRVQVITDGGGFGVLTTDWLIENRLTLARMDKKTRASLRKSLPPHVIIKNPLDLTGDATVERYSLAIDAAIRDPNVDMIAVIALFQIPTLTADIVDVISAASDRSTKPIIVIAAGGRFTEVLKKTLENSGVPTFSYPEKAARALRALYDFSLEKA